MSTTETTEVLDEAYLKHLSQVFDDTPVIGFIEQDLTFEGPGVARVVLRCKPQYNHLGGCVHGGVLGLVMDNAGFMACASLSQRRWVTTCEYKVQLLAPANTET